MKYFKQERLEKSQYFLKNINVARLKNHPLYTYTCACYIISIENVC